MDFIEFFARALREEERFLYVDWEIMTATYILMAVGLSLPDKKVM